MNSILHRVALASLVLCAGSFHSSAADAKTPSPKKLPNALKAEGTDFAFGGEGEGKGKFFQIADIDFDRAGNLHVLDGLIYDKPGKQWLGNALVQKFDSDGDFLSQFSVRNALLGENDAPNRMAIDSAGRIYITKTSANVVDVYSSEGKSLRIIEFPGASGIAVWRKDGKEKIAVIAGTSAVVNRKRVMVGGDEIGLIDPESGAIESRIKLEHPLENVDTLETDAAGNFYVLASVTQLYKFSPTGKLLDTFGSGATKPRATDGSQLSEALAVDSKGDVVAGSWGDAMFVDPQFQTVVRRPGRFNVATSWGYRPRYAFDPQDRLWVAVTARNDAKASKTNKYYSDKPAVMRLAANYYELTQPNVTKNSTKLIGFLPQLTSSVSYHVAMKPGAFPLELVLPAARRRLSEVQVRWRLLDTWGKEVEKGAFDLALKDNEAVSHAFTVTPPRNGWFAVVTEYVDKGTVLTTDANFIGVTVPYTGMDAPPDGGVKGGWEDAPRQVFSGLPFMRLHPGKSLDKLDEDIKAANAAGANFIAQLTNESNCTPEYVRELVTKFKGRIPIYEIINEPNISLKGGLTRYVEIWKTVAPIIREIDPQAKLMGPATVNIDLKWIEQFFAECAPLVDMVSVHDYEGHNTYDSTHWNWKFGELRKLMEKYGIKDKPLWQTERVTLGVARGNFMGTAQAVLLTYHYDLLETLGIPPEHNQHYYLNEGGYASVPGYVWSSSGPHPAALAMRTRTALTRDRKYLGTVDFGPNGNKAFMALRYGAKEGDGGLIVLRNIGMPDTPLALDVSGTPEVRDCFDNAIEAKPVGGKLTVNVTQMPTYLRLPAGASVTFPQWNWGGNFASEAKFAYSAPAVNPAAPEVKDKPDAPAGVVPATPEDAVVNPHNLLPELLTPDPFKILTNGLLETHHGGDPLGGTSKSPRFVGELTSFPQTLDIAFPAPRPISHLAIFSERGDNAFCALLDYDVQAWQAGAWKTVAEVRATFPASTVAEAFHTTTLTWMCDPNRYFHTFATPITTDKLRLVIRRTSFGFAPDDGVRHWSQMIKPQLMLKEIEIY